MSNPLLKRFRASTTGVVALDDKVYPTYKIARLASLLAEQGVVTSDLIAQTGIHPEELTSNAARISRRQVMQTYQNSLALSRDPAIGLAAGSRLRLTDYGIYGYGLISSETLRKALEFSIKYHQLATPTVQMALIMDQDRPPIFRMEDRLYVATLYRFNIEMQFALVFSLFKEMMGDSFRFLRIEAVYPKPTYASVYEELFQCEVVFSAHHNDMIFSADILDQKLQRANPITATTIRELCDQILLEMHATGALAGAVYSVITKDLRAYSEIDSVAQVLHTSPRTLSRKLAAQGVTFSGLLNEIRMLLAIEFLKHTSMSTEEIADRLGYSDPANFRHAFKRWTGKTTGEYRMKGSL